MILHRALDGYHTTSPMSSCGASVPEIEVTLDAGALVEELHTLWEKATGEERRSILLEIAHCMRLTLIRVRGGDRGRSNYTVNTGSLSY